MFRNCFALAFLALVAGPVLSADSPLDSLKSTDAPLQSAGAMAFGPDGILFVGDEAAAAVVALDTGDRTAGKKADVKIEKIDGKIASLLGVEIAALTINDLAVNPISGNIYLSVSRGKGKDAAPVILKIDGTGKIGELSLKGIKSSTAALPNAGKGAKGVITDMAYAKGNVYVAGMSTEGFDSTFRSMPFPFGKDNKVTGVGIYHGAHGAFETRSPVRTFVPFEIAGEANLLAAYQCTPLVKFPVGNLKAGDKIKGTTIAELGSGNAPLDMIVYKKEGKDYLLITNTKRSVMKVPTEGMDKATAITEGKNGTPHGHKYESVESIKGVQQLDKLDDARGVVLIRTPAGDMNLETIPLP